MPDSHSCHCSIVPPHILEKLASHPDPKVRAGALQSLQFAAATRAMRDIRASAPAMSAIPSAMGEKERLVYDAENRSIYYLPGKLKRREGQGGVGDGAVDEAYDYSGVVYDFFARVLARNSLDDRGMALISSVHVGAAYNNAFWNGEQMAYGDGDGVIFGSFTKSLDVVGHELAHGVVTHTSNLEYRDEPGALNEHFADVFGVVVRQWHLGHDVEKADWLVGADLIANPASRPKTRGLRAFDAAPAYDDDPYLGDDPQPKHYSRRYEGSDDHGGVHINSGIPNHAFYLFARSLGGNAWEKAGKIWYETLRRLKPTSKFVDMVNHSRAVTNQMFGPDDHAKLDDAWKAVGL